MKIAIRGLLIIVAGVLLAQPTGEAAASTAGITFAPHRAVYEMQLDEKDAAQNIAAVRGRMVFEIKGSHCAGYAVSNRMVTRIADAEGGEVVSDIRSSTWENGEGTQFRFDSSQYLDNRLTESLRGEAERRGNNGTIAVKLKHPQTEEVTIPGDARFPTQFSREILEAARNGKRIVQAKVYDGAEDGDQVFNTTTFVGEPTAPGGAEARAEPEVAEALDKVRSWPVSISYFEVGANSDSTPSYQLSFRLYETGISRELRIDYGTFALKGTLSSLELHKPAPCAPPPG